MKPRLQGRGRGFTAVFDGVFNQRLKNDAWNQRFPRFIVDLEINVQFPVKPSPFQGEIPYEGVIFFSHGDKVVIAMGERIVKIVCQCLRHGAHIWQLLSQSRLNRGT
jgi:hypothetical protein